MDSIANLHLYRDPGKIIMSPGEAFWLMRFLPYGVKCHNIPRFPSAVRSGGFRLSHIYSESVMKADIHPHYEDIKVVCSCGNEFVTRSTLGQEELHVEVCSSCHPFFTGKQKMLDTAGRVDKFRKKYNR